jgi:hypothetical protein
VVEDINRAEGIENSRPEDVYTIARFLGARVDALPAVVFFTELQSRDDTLVLRLRERLPGAEHATDEAITTLFGALAAA